MTPALEYKIRIALIRWSESDECGCEHDQDTCCAKVDEPCCKCEAAELLAEIQQPSAATARS